MLCFFHMAVVHVGAGVEWLVEHRQAAPDGYPHRGVRLAVEDGPGIAEPVPVQRVLVNQVRPHLQPHVGELDAIFLPFIYPEERGRRLALHLLGKDQLIGQAGYIPEAKHVGG